MNPRYRIFYSWQSDNNRSKSVLDKALDDVVKQLKQEGIYVSVEQGGGGLGFISIEDSVRIKIRRCDIFVGDITPVGNVSLKGKLLPNANVMYEMGVATECMHAERILAVAQKGEWKIEDMPFDFRQYPMLLFDSEDGVQRLYNELHKRIKETNKLSRIANGGFFSSRLVNRNIDSGKYLPDTFVENRSAKDKARLFLAPAKMYSLVFERFERMNFDHYNKIQKLQGKNSAFKLNIKKWDIKGKAIDMDILRGDVESLYQYIMNKASLLNRNNHAGWTIEHIADDLAIMNKQLMLVTSAAGHGKTNFVCDLIKNVLTPEGIPYVFVNAYELSAEQLAKSIAAEYNFIGNDSLEEVLVKVEQYCNQQLQYFVIVIDGLNEHPKQGLFKSNLNRILNEILRFKHVKVLMTCREEFYRNNYNQMQISFSDDLCHISLNKHRRDLYNDESEEDQCLMERYAKHFDTQGNLNPSIRRELINRENLLLLRIFFETYQGQDLSGMNQINYIDLFDRYYAQLCDKTQSIIDQGTHVSNSQRIFEKIISWMVKHGIFRNIPLEECMKELSIEEQQSLPSFLNANLIIRQDTPEGVYGVYDVLNFTFEEIRDYLVVRYLVDVVYAKSKKHFSELIEEYTNDNNNQAEGTRRFLFLYTRIKDLHNIYHLLQEQPWHNSVFMEYIWNIPEEKLTDDDIKRVKTLILSNPQRYVKLLTYYHWSPTKYPKLNLNTLFEILKGMSKKDRDALYETVWPSKIHHNFYGHTEVSDRGQFLSVLIAGIKRRKGVNDNDASVLERLYNELYNSAKYIYIPLQKEEPQPSPYVFLGYDMYHYLMKVSKGDKKEFLRKAGVKNGFAKDMFGTLYDTVFAEAIDVKEMYETFYANEYKDLSHFLSMRYSIPVDQLQKYVRACNSKNHRLIDFDPIVYGGGGAEFFELSNDMVVRVYKWLNWRDYENKN